MNRICHALRVVVVGFMLGFGGTASAAAFTNGGFEGCGGVNHFGVTGTTIPGWTVNVGNIDWETNTVGVGWQSSEGGCSLDLVGGGAGGIGGIQQTFDTVAGAMYQIAFDLAGNYGGTGSPIKPLDVTINGVTTPFTFNTTGHGASDMGWTTKTIAFVAGSSSSTINFVSDVSGAGGSLNAGAAIDNVSIVRAFLVTTTGLFSSLNPATFGNSVTFTVQVHGSTSSPTGTINFTDNGSPICTAVPLGPTGSPLIATADCITSSLAVGNHTIGATYSGDVLNAGSNNSLVQVVNPVVIAALPWVGSAGSVTNPGTGPIPPPGPYPGTTLESSPTVVPGHDGTGGASAEFTYQTVNSFCCHTGDWNFETPVTTAGDVRVNWTYSGYHGTCSAMASLRPYIRRAGVTTYGAPLYSQADSVSPCTGLLPSGGFGDGGQALFVGLVNGDSYGFTMHASNFDSNGAVGGMLTVTFGAGATSVALGSSSNPVAVGSPVTFTATVTGNAPTGHVTFTQEGRELQGCRALPLVGNTAVCSMPSWFAGPPRAILALYSGDSVNAGSVSAPLTQVVNTLVTVPSAPTIGFATAGNAQISVMFSPPASNGGSPITSYTATCGALSASGNFAPIVVTGLTNGTSYTCTVTATNAIGTGPASLPSNLATPAAPFAAPGAPTIGAATAGNGQISVAFTAPAYDGGSPITSYTATCGSQSASGPASPIVVTGLANGTSYSCTVTATNAVGTSPPSGASNSVTPLASVPTLIRAIENTGGTSATIIGRVDGAPPGASVQPFIVGSCSNGVSGGTASPVGLPVAPNGDGYVVATTTGVASGQFVALQLIQAGTPISGLSTCLPSLGNNDFWTTALLVGADSPAAGTASANDYIDAPGKARWYKFKVAPGQQISVSLTGLPADYDVAVFKDIGTAFAAQLAPADSAALTKLSAEFAPSTFSPSTFSPSTFSPSTFSPSTFSADAFAPSTFSPSTFSPSTFSPSTFSPSTFSPSTFSPSTFSPSTFSPSTFSPSTFSPSTFSPSTFSDDIIRTAFSSAQTRSLVGVSATAGTANESVVVDSWNNGGYFYARVTGRGAAFSTTGQFTISAAKSASSCASVTDTTLTPRSAVAGSSIQTVILTDTSSFASYAADDVTSMNNKLLALASATGGVIVDVAGDSRVQALKAQALRVDVNLHIDNRGCPFATNLVAEEIKGIADSYRMNNPLRFVVIAGGDDVIPFFRYPDQTMIGQESDYVPPVSGVSDASLRGNFVLSQDAYGSKTRVSLGTSDFPVPGLAVGRLVKTPTEIAGMIDAALPYLTTAGGALQPGSSLVTGYDFLADVAGAIANELLLGTGASPERLIAPNNISPLNTASWHAADLAAKLFGSRHDVVFLAGHFSANSTLAADFATNLITSDLAASNTDFTNSIVFSAGCHSGYSIVNRDALSGVTFTLDWAQAFAQKKATLIAGTGYQYGDTDFIEYSERIYRNFARELHAGSGALAIGEALVNAKIDYLAATPDIRGIHTKALLESTLYGLPMLGINMPSGRGGVAGASFDPAQKNPVIDPLLPAPATGLGLRVVDLPLVPSVTMPPPLQLTGDQSTIPGPLATWLEGFDGVVSNPSEPALPLNVVNATSTDGRVLRGVGFRGGSYSDSLIVPLTGAPATDIRGVHTSFAAPNFFPNRPWTVNYFGALAGNGATSLLVTPAQHRGADVGADGFLRSTLRRYSTLNLRLYYSDNRSQASLSDAPTIVKADAQAGGNGSVIFTAQVTGDPAAAIAQVWITYTDGGGAWVPVELAQCAGTPLPPICGTTADSQIWKGTTPESASAVIRYVVQAASGMGLVTFDDNRGAYYLFNANFGGSTTAQAAAAAATELSFESAPASATYGDTVSVRARLTYGGQSVPGGLVNMNIGGFGNAGLTDANGRVTLSATVSSAPGVDVPITASYAGSGTSLLPSAAATSFTVQKAVASLTALASPAVGVRVTAPVVGNTSTQQPVTGQSVSFLFANAGFTKTIVVNTDTSGNATVPTAGLPAGMYSVTAQFLPAQVAGQDSYYTGATIALASFTMNTQSIAFTSPTPTTPVTYSPPGTFSVAAAVSGSNAGQQVTITSTTPDVCTVAGTPALPQASYTATIVRGGADCVLSADVGGSNTYAPAHAAATITIVKATQTITSLTAPTAFTAPGTFTGAATAASPNSGQTVTITSTTPGICTVADSPVANGATYTATLVAGDANCVIAANLGGNNYYTAAHREATIAIVKAAQAITISGLSSPPSCNSPVKTYGNPSFTVSVTGGTSGVPVTLTSTTPGVCSVSSSGGTATVGIDGAGTCSITANQAGNDLYNTAPPVTQCFTVNQAGQTINNFAAIAPKTFGVDAPFVVSPDATSSAGFPVTLSAAGRCTISRATPPATVTLTGAGVCTITAAAPGNANYAAVSPGQTFSIAGTPQTISFANPGDKALGTPAFPLMASATSGLPVTFAVQGTTDVCTLLPNGVTLKLLSSGVCTIAASQSATNSNYAAATNVVQSFKVYLSGFAGLASVTIGASNALVDSFDSTPGFGGYAATKGAAVNVLSNGTANVQGAKVWGNVESAQGNVTLAPGSLVTGNVTAATTVSNSGTVSGTVAANQPLPSIAAPAIIACTPYTPATPAGWITGNYSYNAAKGDLTISGQNTATLASGTYCLNSITLSGNSTLTVSGPVKINLTGAFTASGNSVVNPTLIPRNLQVVTSYTGNSGVTMSGNATGYFTIYAPGTGITLSGNAVLFGAAVGKSLTGSGNPQMHYDVKTLDVWRSIFGL